jgi:hypothetical protein
MNPIARLLMKQALWKLTKRGDTSTVSLPAMSGGHPVLNAQPVTDDTEALDDSGAESAGRPQAPFGTLIGPEPGTPSMAIGAGGLMNSSRASYGNETLGGGFAMSAPPAKIAMLMRNLR